jgi:tetratricopeptide (TPR) repeat protein
MASRLIDRLDRAIAEADDPLRRECLKAERVGALARHGLLAEARFALAGVRTQSQRRRDPRLSAWVSLVEGQIEHFECVAPKAAEKFQQAHATAAAAGDSAMRALAAAWLSALALNASDKRAFATWVVEALEHAAPDQHAAWARLGLVLADALRFAGDEERSQRWHAKAREHASADGDTAMISALLHNISAMRSARIGLDDAFGRADLSAAQKALLEADSTSNYDWGSGAAALAAMVPLVRAQLLVVLGRFEEAQALFDAYAARVRNEGMAHREPRFLADRAWCQVQCGRTAAALREARTAQRHLDPKQDADDLAATHARLARVFEAAGHAEDAAQHQAKAEEALSLYRVQQREWLSTLNLALERLA